MTDILKDLVIVNPELLEESQKIFNKIINDKTGSAQLQKNSNFAKDKYSLIIRAPASHGGRLTDNRAVYIPSRMKVSAKTMYSPYKKPILREHSTGGRGFLGDSDPQDPIGRIFEAHYHDTIKIDKFGNPSSLRVKDSLALIKQLMKSKQIYDRGFEGLGYLRIGAKITNQDAIEKFLDETYLTLSVSFIPLEKFNPHTEKSVSDRSEDDPYPFDTIDNMPGFIVIGQKEYVETSAVSIPASSLAIVEKDMELVKDNLNSNYLKDCFNPNEEKYQIDNNSSCIIVDGLYTLENNETIQPNEDKKNTKDKTEKNKMNHLKELNEKLKTLNPTEISEDSFNSFTADSFCGPDKTFPVVDATTYKASVALLSDSTMSTEDKALVEKNIKRKAAKLKLRTGEVSTDSLSNLSDFDLIKTANSFVHYAVKDRQIPLEDLSAIGNLLEDSKKDLVEAKRTELESKDTEIKGLQKLIEDSNEELKKSKELSFKLLTSIKDNLKLDLDVKVDKSLNELSTELDSLIKDTNVHEKLNRFLSGLGQKPEEDKVADPTLKAGEENVGPLFNIVLDSYKKTKEDKGEMQAEEFLSGNLEKGYISQDEYDEIIKKSSN